MLTVKLVAARTGVSQALVYSWIGSGMLPHFRMGKKGSRGAIRVSEADLEAFMASLKKGDGPAEPLPPAQKRQVIFRHVRIRKPT